MNNEPLTEQRKQELQSAFNGANSIALLLCFILLTALPILWISDKMTGWMQITGLVVLSLFTAFILMLFVTGLIKAILKAIFSALSSEYKALFTEQENQNS
jgi:K+-sensing histidine kinase KdpD